METIITLDYMGAVTVTGWNRDRELRLRPRLYAGSICHDSVSEAAVVALYK